MESPEIVSPESNFDHLNIPPLHPAREEHGFFSLNKNKLILRSHLTSSHKELNLYKESPYKKVYLLGKVYRNDKDSTHLNIFHQIDLLIMENTNLLSFIELLRIFLIKFFQREIELIIRPNYFPFTVMSFEIDLVMEGRVYEICGAGLMNRKVLKINEYEKI